MNKKVLKKIVLSTLLLMPLKAFALEDNVNLVCEKNKLLAGEKTNCQIVVNSETNGVLGVDFKLSFDSNLVIDNVLKNAIWQGDLDNKDISDNNGKQELRVVLFKGEPEFGTGISLGSFDLAVKPEVKPSTLLVTSVGTVTLSDKNDNAVNIPFTDYEIKVPSKDNSLKKITVDGKIIDNYDEKTKTYKYQVASSKKTVELDTFANDVNAKIKDGKRTLNLKYGDNNFVISVTSEAGETIDYNLVINRIDDRSSEKDLLAFSFFNYDIKFDKNKTEYNIKVGNDIDKFGMGVGEITDYKNTLLINFEKISMSPKSAPSFILNGVDITSNLLIMLENSTPKCNEDESHCDLYYQDKKIGDYEYIKKGDKYIENTYIVFDNLKEGKNTLTLRVIAENETTKDYVFNIDRAYKNIHNNPETGLKDYITYASIALLFIGISYIGIKKHSKFPLK